MVYTDESRNKPAVHRDFLMVARLSSGQFYGKLLRCHTVGGLTLTETLYPPGACLPRHCHEHAYFCLVCRGTYREEYGGQVRSCGPLMLAFHPPEEMHAEHFDGEEVRSFNVEITPQWLRNAAGAAQVQPFDFRGGPLVGLALRLREEFERPDASSALIIEGLTLELLGLCARESRSGAAGPVWLRRVRDLLTDCCCAPFTLAGLAAEAGVHPRYLAEAFRRHYGCTVGTYVRRQRVARACRQLTDSGLPLVEVALAVGFADQSHFTRVFKRQTGLTPAAYRKMTTQAASRSKT
jgi:AraC-like DNA-binding protein